MTMTTAISPMQAMRLIVITILLRFANEKERKIIDLDIENHAKTAMTPILTAISSSTKIRQLTTRAKLKKRARVVCPKSPASSLEHAATISAAAPALAASCQSHNDVRRAARMPRRPGGAAKPPQLPSVQQQRSSQVGGVGRCTYLLPSSHA